MIKRKTLSIIKKIKERREIQQFRENLFSRDRWMVEKFNLPELSKSELHEINEVWPFIRATNNDLIWNRMYKFKHGFDPYYLSDYQVQPIYKALNPSVDVEFLKNKALIDIYCSEIAFPKTYIKCINGFLSDHDGNAISESESIDILRATGETSFIIKPSINSGCGKGVRIIHAIKEEILDVIHNSGNNFIIQECLQQCEFLSRLNDSSINTCRLTSLYLDGTFSFSTILKIGKKGAIIDNWNSSYFIGINSKGYLATAAYDYKLDEVIASDSGVKFEGLLYPDFSQITSAIELYHKKYFPTLGILGWDVFIDNHHNVRIIEVNPDYPGIKGAQLCVGTFFKEHRNSIVNKVMNIHKQH